MVNELSLWQLATYAFVHMPPYWLFLIELYLLVVFGREIEGYLGRGAFIRFYLTLLLAPTLLFTAAEWLGWHTGYAGSSALHFGVFVAFALIYPTAEMFFGIQAKWIALALLAINSLQCLALSDYEALAVLAVLLAWIAQAGTPLAGVLLLTAFAAGQVLPLLLAGTAAAWVPRLLALRALGQWVPPLSGAVLLLTGALTLLAQWS